MTDYQRACEIVGCPTGHEAMVSHYATQWLASRGGVSVHEHDGGYKVCTLPAEPIIAPTLTEALTAAVLAVAGETK